jgi:hypothetical protein
MKQAVARHDLLVRDAIEAHDGVVFSTAGDAFCAAFSSPRRTIEAALAAQLALADQDWDEATPLLVRMALHTGNADERDGDYFGPPLNRCARLLSTGHGGQTLVSAATAELLRDQLPGGTGLEDLGPQQLRDLERPERVYQVVHPDLRSGFGPLRSEGPVQEADALLTSGQVAHASCQWQAAYEALSAASADVDLDAADLERLGDAAWWTGRSDEGVAAREQAFGAYIREGSGETAAVMALALAESYGYRLAESVSRAWTIRAERLLDGVEETAAYGHLLRWKTVVALESEGDVETATLRSWGCRTRAESWCRWGRSTTV